MHLLYWRIFLLLSFTATSIAQDVTSASASPTALALTISNDGTCSSGLTCAGSPYGQCCSQHGFCGTGDAYCGGGCQAEFGSCGSLEPTTSSIVLPNPATVTVTKTVSVFATGLLTTTATVTAAVTRTVLTTSTNVVSRTQVQVCRDSTRTGSLMLTWLARP